LQAGKENKDAWQAGTMLGPGLAPKHLEQSREHRVGQGAVSGTREDPMCHFDRTLLIHPPGTAPSFSFLVS